MAPPATQLWAVGSRPGAAGRRLQTWPRDDVEGREAKGGGGNFKGAIEPGDFSQGEASPPGARNLGSRGVRKWE